MYLWADAVFDVGNCGLLHANMANLSRLSHRAYMCPKLPHMNRTARARHPSIPPHPSTRTADCQHRLQRSCFIDLRGRHGCSAHHGCLLFRLSTVSTAHRDICPCLRAGSILGRGPGVGKLQVCNFRWMIGWCTAYSWGLNYVKRRAVISCPIRDCFYFYRR